ncbi:MAG: hypothetical protein ACPGC9_00170 [Cytophagales bacterium]
MDKKIYNEIIKEVKEMDEDYHKFSEKGNKAAAIRARKKLRKIVLLSTELRKEIQNLKSQDKKGSLKNIKKR